MTLVPLLAAVPLVAAFLPMQARLTPQHLNARETVAPIDQTWDWKSISPSSDLKWTSCYDGAYDCARLDVPMNWQEPSDNDRVALGVIRLKAKTGNNTLPPVFINPGGPGGSGIAFMKSSGALIQTIVGAQHDIISFDPRGLGVSTPRVDCWRSATKQAAWNAGYVGGIDQWSGLAYQAFARGQAFSDVCKKSMNGTNLLENLSTATAARDMLEILEKSGHSKLRYWGLSYGTILGGVFAGLYPDKVDRLVSDGNVDYEDWFTLGYRNFLADADTIADAFDNTCYKVGEEKCALWSNTPRKIRDRRERILEQVKTHPVVIPAGSIVSSDGESKPEPDTPQFLTYALLQIFTRGSFYAPVFKVADMARVYAAAEKNDGSVYYTIASKPGPMIATKDTPIDEPRETFAENDAAFAISCSDWLGRDDADGFLKYTQELEATSKWVGGASTFQRLACAGWPTKQNWHVTKKDFKGETAHPILFIGNMADIITPLQSARNNSATFPGSGVLIQNSYGHSSLASPSTCTAKYIRQYFDDGSLPPKGTICDEDYHIFDFPGVDAVHPQDELSSAILHLSSAWASD